MTDKVEVGKRIRYARINAWDNRTMTQADLAKYLNCSRDTVRNWESGRIIPDNKKLEKIANICRVDWRWLLLGDVINGYTDESLKDIMVDSFKILDSFNPYAEDEQFKKALFKVIGCWGIGLDVDIITDQQLFYGFMKKAIISNVELYMTIVDPLTKQEDENE